MDLVSIVLMMQLMKDNGYKAKSKAREKLFSKVVVYLKVNLKMISSMDMEKCTIILLETFFRGNGLKISKKEQVLWIGQIWGKSMLEVGTKIFSMAGVFTSGLNQKAKANFWGIDMKAIGLEEFEKDSELFIMRTDQNMKDIGRTIWNKD